MRIEWTTSTPRSFVDGRLRRHTPCANASRTPHDEPQTTIRRANQPTRTTTWALPPYLRLPRPLGTPSERLYESVGAAAAALLRTPSPRLRASWEQRLVHVAIAQRSERRAELLPPRVQVVHHHLGLVHGIQQAPFPSNRRYAHERVRLGPEVRVRQLTSAQLQAHLRPDVGNLHGREGCAAEVSSAPRSLAVEVASRL
eukprot:scaffold571_cov364-Prasinococcus_capsulatus_cf.AAC.18